jgi:hypothetical protein
MASTDYWYSHTVADSCAEQVVKGEMTPETATHNTNIAKMFDEGRLESIETIHNKDYPGWGTVWVLVSPAKEHWVKPGITPKYHLFVNDKATRRADIYDIEPDGFYQYGQKVIILGVGDLHDQIVAKHFA